MTKGVYFPRFEDEIIPLIETKNTTENGWYAISITIYGYGLGKSVKELKEWR